MSFFIAGKVWVFPAVILQESAPIPTLTPPRKKHLKQPRCLVEANALVILIEFAGKREQMKGCFFPGI